jgi:serine/threonine-protein kinase
MAHDDTVILPATGQRAAPERVGRYEIRALIGQGAMAAVYRAYDPQINRPIAIKLLQQELCENDAYRLRFIREAKGAGVLSHPNIVTVYDVGEEGGRPYIAMELVEGETLADLLREKKPVDTKLAVEIGIQLAKALDYAHRKGIVHRDVKPGNIMLVRDTNTAKVADFGICRIDDSDATHKTRVGDVLGTPHYMSPEQVLGQRADARSDLFSAGIVLYQLLSGVLPFDGDTLVSVALKITKSDPVSLDRLRPDLPLGVRRVVDRALRKAPEKRFQSGEEMANALIEVAREIREADAAKERERRVPMRVRWATLMALLLGLTIAIAGTLISRGQRNALQDQVMDYGASLARFMASQTAVPMLAEDWTGVEVFVQDAAGDQDFAYLQVVDRDNVVRGSSVPAQIGSRYAPPVGQPVATRDAALDVERHTLADGRDVLDFIAPIRFQGKEIGRVHLGIFETPLTRVSRLTWLMLGLLTLLTSAAGALGSYFLAQRLSQPLRVLKGALAELAKGNYAYRIGETRRDELGELYSAFDTAADALEKRYDTLAPPTLLASLPGEAQASATTTGPSPAEAEHRPGPSRPAEAVAGSTSA